MQDRKIVRAFLLLLLTSVSSQARFSYSVIRSFTFDRLHRVSCCRFNSQRAYCE